MKLPETVLSFSPSLAAKIGLHEAIVVQWLSALSAVDAYQGFQVDVALCQQRLGFFSLQQLEHTFQSLHSQGVIELKRSENGVWQGILPQQNDNADSSTNHTPSSLVSNANNIEVQESNLAASNLPERNQPSSDLAAERASTSEVQAKPATSARPTVPSQSHLSPSQSSQGGVVVNHTRQRNQNPAGQISYLKGQSGRTQPAGMVKMDEHWLPSAQFTEMLQFHNISADFAMAQLAAFRVYYIQSGKTAFSWDTRFMNWVQRAWADQLRVKGKDEQKAKDAQPQSDAKQRKEAVRQQLRDIHDTSWAE